MEKAFRCPEIVISSRKSIVSGPSLHVYSSDFRISLDACKVVLLINVVLDLFHIHTKITLNFYRENETEIRL